MKKLTIAPHIVESVTDDANIEFALVLYSAGTHCGKFGIRITDLDANEVVGLSLYPNSGAACTAYAKLVKDAKTVSVWILPASVMEVR